MDYLDFFGLKEDPFKLTPDPAYFYPSSTHNEGLLLLDYSIEQKEGFTTIIGDPGSGKTTLLNVFLEKWKPKAEIAIILTPRLSPEEFLVSVLEDLNIHLPQKNKNEIIKAFRDFMVEKSSEGKRVIIIIDEAQNLPEDTLEELRLLSNLETDKDKLLQIALIGQPELESKLMTAKLRQLNQRIITRIHLRPLTADETLDYINHRLIKAGRRNLKINKKAGRLISRYSNGIPRLINMVMSRALMAAYLEEGTVIYPRHIVHAVKSLRHDDLKIKRGIRLVPVLIALLLMVMSGVVSYNYLPDIISSYQKEIIEDKSQSADIGEPEVRGQSTEGGEQNAENTIQNTEIKMLEDIDKESTVKNDEEAVIGEKAIKDEKPPTGRYVTVRLNANLRDAPSFSSNTVGWALKGDRLEILDRSEDSRWYQVLHKGKKRWIFRDVVKLE